MLLCVLFYKWIELDSTIESNSDELIKLLISISKKNQCRSRTGEIKEDGKQSELIDLCRESDKYQPATRDPLVSGRDVK